MNLIELKIYYYELKQTFRLALPIIVNQIGQVLFGVLDSAMIGRVGSVPLASASFSTSVFFVFMVFGIGVSACVSTLVAQAHGGQRKREAGEILRHSLVINGLNGLVLSLCLYVLSFHLEIFGQQKEVVAEAKDFFSIIGWSLWPVLIYQCFRQFAEGLGYMKPAMFLIFGGLALNGILNWFLIYGNGGSEALGLYGAGLATFIVRWLMAIAMAWYVLRSPAFLEYRPLQWMAKLEGAMIRKILGLGLPGGVQFLFEVGAFSVAAIMMGWVSPEALAAHQIALNLASLTFMFAVGISIATSIREGHALGRGDLAEARRIGLTSIAAGGIGMTLFGMIFISFRNYLPLLYVNDPKVLALASSLLVIAGAFQFFDGIQGVSVGALRGLLDVKIPTMITFVAYWVLCIPLAYFFGFTLNGGAPGIWWGLLCGLVFSAVFLTWRFHRKAVPNV